MRGPRREMPRTEEEKISVEGIYFLSPAHGTTFRRQ
jgi:hypothetical protein